MKLAEPCGIAYICFAPRHVLGVTRIDQNDLEPVLLTARAYDTPRSLTSFTASSLNSRVNFRLSMTHLLLHKTPNLVSSEPGAAHIENVIARSQSDEEQAMLRRSLVLLTYAHLEGFCKFALMAYASAINALRLPCKDASIPLV